LLESRKKGVAVALNKEQAFHGEELLKITAEIAIAAIIYSKANKGHRAGE